VETLLEECRSWLKEFEQRQGRPLRVLHVGNIANNAYINAKNMRKAGVEADVLCGDYYHIMGCPEWEEIDVVDYGKDDFYPIFKTKQLKDYKRPEWFVQGPFSACCEYLIAKNKNKKIYSYVLKQIMAQSRKSQKHHYIGSAISLVLAWRLDILWHEIRRIGKRDIKEFFKRIFNFPRSKTIVLNKKFFDDFPFGVIQFFKDKFRAFIFFVKSHDKHQQKNINNVDYVKLIKEFNVFFPDRKDKLSKDEIEYYSSRALLKKVSVYYDIIQCYGIDPIWALASEVEKPYVAFEHGTLRDFIFGDDPIHRLNALAYSKASHVFVTNGDCLENVKKLNIKRYSGIAHPIEGDWDLAEDQRNKIKQGLGADVLLFSPMRHDWSVKGNEIHLEALSKIVQLVKGKVVLVLNQWGKEVERSVKLIQKTGCQEHVIWLHPLCRKRLVEMLYAADVVLDQMLLPCFGGILPQALSVGTPVIMSYRPESTAWLFREPAPVLAAFNEDEVVNSVLLALDPEWRKAYKHKALDWFRRFHHVDIAVNEQLRVYKHLVLVE
jgi:hypothetical protein